MERAYIFLASQKNVGSLRKNPFSHAFRLWRNSAKPVFLAIFSYALSLSIDYPYVLKPIHKKQNTLLILCAT